MKLLSYDQYQDKIAKIKTPGDLAGFAQELVAPLMEEGQNSTSLAVRKPGRKKVQVLIQGGPDATGVIQGVAHEIASPINHQVAPQDLEEQIISLYAKGLTTRDIANYLKASYGLDWSTASISAVTDKVFPLVKEWQARPLSSVYPLLYLDGLHFKVRDAGKIVTKCAYIALGLNDQGYKEVLGIWIAETEGAKLWLQILNELKNRGVESVLIACIDGLKGFPEAITTIFPEAVVQTCIVHQIRHTIKFVPHKDRKRFCDDLKAIYTAPTEEAGFQALETMKEKWSHYSLYLKRWEDRWKDLAPFFGYPTAIRRIMYTTNAIENLNRQFRKVTKTTTVFPHDESLLKLLWLAQNDLAYRWTMPVRNWGEIVAQLSILFPEKMHL